MKRNSALAEEEEEEELEDAPSPPSDDAGAPSDAAAPDCCAAWWNAHSLATSSVASCAALTASVLGITSSASAYSCERKTRKLVGKY